MFQTFNFFFSDYSNLWTQNSVFIPLFLLICEIIIFFFIFRFAFFWFSISFFTLLVIFLGNIFIYWFRGREANNSNLTTFDEEKKRTAEDYLSKSFNFS